MNTNTQSPNPSQALRDEGWHLLHHGGSDARRVHGAEQVLLGYYWRSLEDAVRAGYAARHPAFAEYVRMLDLQHIFRDERIDAALRERYGDPIEGVIPGARSYWMPKGSCRDRQFREARPKPPPCRAVPPPPIDPTTDLDR